MIIDWLKFLSIQLNDITEDDYVLPRAKVNDGDKILDEWPDEL